MHRHMAEISKAICVGMNNVHVYYRYKLKKTGKIFFFLIN